MPNERIRRLVLAYYSKDAPELATLDKKSGIPTTLYHGTHQDFQTFDLGKSGTNRDSGWYGKAIYLTPHRDLAGKYGPNIKVVKVIAENPFHWPKDAGNIRTFVAQGKPFPKEIHNDVISRYEQLKPKRHSTSSGWGTIDTTNDQDYDENLLSDIVAEVLQEKGYDSVIYQHPFSQGTQMEYAVFNPNNLQIISGNITRRFIMGHRKKRQKKSFKTG